MKTPPVPNLLSELAAISSLILVIVRFREQRSVRVFLL